MSRRKKRKHLALMLVFLLLTACRASGGDVVQKDELVVLTILAGQSTSDAGVEEMISETVEQAFPGVKLEWQCVDWGDHFEDAVRARFASGDIPDIIIGKAQDVKPYARTGNLAPISAAAAAGIDKAALEPVTVDGAIYGMPYNAWYQGVIYHKSIFQELNLVPPQTLAEMEAVIDVLNEEGITPFAAHFQEIWFTGNTTMQFMVNELFRHNPQWGDDFRAGTEHFRRNPVVEQCIRNNQTILENSWADALYIDQYECDSRFGQKKAAMYLTGAWSLQFLDKDAQDLSFGIFPYPALDGEACLIRETNMTMMKSARSPHSELIDRLFTFLLSQDELMQEVLDFTQTDSVVANVPAGFSSYVQEDLDAYRKEGKIIEVSAGNSQLVWAFQREFAARQLEWLKGNADLEAVLEYADRHRDESLFVDDQ